MNQNMKKLDWQDVKWIYRLKYNKPIWSAVAARQINTTGITARWKKGGESYKIWLSQCILAIMSSCLSPTSRKQRDGIGLQLE
jgi:hypothetical protein